MALTSDITYSSAIAADDFTQAEVDNLRTAKLDDATTPWTNASNITSGTLTNISAATPTADTHVATKAYVDAAGGGCYSKCADSGTAAGGATPSCPGGYSSVDIWSERAGYAMKQWQGMNGEAFVHKSTMQTAPTVRTQYNYYHNAWSGWGGNAPPPHIWIQVTPVAAGQLIITTIAELAAQTNVGLPLPKG